MDIKTLKGIAVVAIDDGARLGSVNDVLSDLDHRRVRAFVVSDGGLFGGKNRILDIGDVQSVGADAVMIQSRDVLKADREDARYQAYPNLHALTSLRVVSQNGDLVGNISTIHFEASDGAFTDLEISKHGLLGSFQSKIICPAAAAVSMGRDVVVIPNDYAGQSQNNEKSGSTENLEAPSAS
ncbi:MAG: PRC-barrel domain-containing protein [Nitrolancea sp.]